MGPPCLIQRDDKGQEGGSGGRRLMSAPLVCVTLEGTTVDEIIREAGRASVAGADLVEVRFDRLYVKPAEPEPEPSEEGEEEAPAATEVEAPVEAPAADESDEEGDEGSLLDGAPLSVDPLAGVIGLAPGESHLPLSDVDVEASIERLASGIELPVIFTCRPPAEGGCYPGDEASRLAILRTAIESGVSWIDLEVAIDDSVRNELVTLAGEKGSKVIGSHHDLERTPDQGEIIEWLQANRDAGDVVKVCYRCSDPIDGLRLIEAGWSVPGDVGDVAMMGVGPSGDWIRLHAPVMHQALVYSVMSTDFSLHERGLVNVKELRQAWDVLEYD